MPSSKSRMSSRMSSRLSARAKSRSSTPRSSNAINSNNTNNTAKSSKKSRMSTTSRASVSSKKSRVSSSKSSVSAGTIKTDYNTAMVTFLLGLIIQGLILYYLYNLEGADCNCIRDWRHNFCKLFAILVILINLAALFTDIHNNKIFAVVWGSITVVNAYAFFTYISDLNATQCTCAVTKQPNLNSIMILFRWIELLTAVVVFFAIISILYTGITA